NMIDMVEEIGEHIDEQQLAHLLGCPVVAISATKKIGIDTLYQQIEQLINTPQVATPTFSTLGEAQEQILNHYLPDFANIGINRWQLIEALLGNLSFTLTPQQQQLLQQ